MTKDTYLRLLGSRILNEATDLKRTPAALASDLGLEEARVLEVLSGRADREDVLGVVRRMGEVYPIDASDLLVLEDDCTDAAKIVRSADSERSRRVFERPDRHGNKTPYYEYRDTAMSRLSPYRPEWIRELRLVTDADPLNPDVIFNRGHFMHQYTLFVGPVNFYWEIGGKKFGREMETGDSFYITPYLPHTFTTRDASRPAYILAVTFGGDVRRAQKEICALGSRGRDYYHNYRDRSALLLARVEQVMRDGLMTPESVATAAKVRAPSLDIRKALTDPAALKLDELALLAACFEVELADLLVPTFIPEEEVAIQSHKEAPRHPWPDSRDPWCEVAPMVRARRMGSMRGAVLRVKGGDLPREGWLSSSLHTWIYNFGDHPVAFGWRGQEEHRDVLAPGDSAYLQPFVPHAFARVSGGGDGHLCQIRISGAVTPETQRELSAFPAGSMERIHAETKTWF